MRDSTNIVGLDFETYSDVDLPTHGVHRYVSSPAFTPLIASLAFYDENWNNYWTKRIDFTNDYHDALETLALMLSGRRIAAHNAPFEQWVLDAMGIYIPSSMFRDSAVVARASGAAGKLEAAAPQLLGADKLESGSNLIKLFCIPGKYQEETDSRAFDRRVVDDHLVEWQQFGEYCDTDALLSLRLVLEHGDNLPSWEWQYQAITMDMNRTGWPVDVPVVEEMQRRYLENIDQAVADFNLEYGEDAPNLNSLKQMKEFCEKRGIRAKSFDEKNVAKLMDRITRKVIDLQLQPVSRSNMDKVRMYEEVLHLLRTKQTLGGSSLKKLQVILDTTGKDCRLRDQYLHIGAGQSYRTTGRGVQMQNLKRLSEIGDMAELDDLDIEWDNDKLAENIRQCFTSSDINGQLIVGDFSSVEARGLAWLAAAHETLDSFRKGLDLYKVQAATMFGVPYNQVTKAQRQTGKVGVLSCGYQAGGGAVQSFAEGMGVVLTEGEANKLVSDWRAANPKIVDLWARIDEILNDALDMEHGVVHQINVGPSGNYILKIYKTHTPSSLGEMHTGATTLRMDLLNPNRELILSRFFHGCYRRGRNVCYYKPTERKTGDVWVNHYTDPKTKQVRFYSIYGGKIAGILTQSLCREIFFDCLKRVHAWVSGHSTLDLIGQFHDEIVVDWKPGQISLDDAKMGMKHLMSDTHVITGFPLEADIKSDYRYTK